jgi:hypothetical protein
MDNRIGIIALFVAAAAALRCTTRHVADGTEVGRDAGGTRDAIAPVISERKCDLGQVARVCRSAKDETAFTFSGEYADVDCTQPVVHADVRPCSTVHATGLATITFSEELAGHRRNDSTRLDLGGQVPSEGHGLYLRQSGTCRAYLPEAPVAPPGCDGKMVCRAPDNTLTCGRCTVLEGSSECPQYEASRVYALLSLIPRFRHGF